MEKKKVFFSHQSTLAHYRVDLFNEIERLKPDWLEFEVGIDESDEARKLFFKKQADIDKANFKLKKTKTLLFNRSYPILYQSFLNDINDYDLVILQHALHNLSYPLSSFVANKTKVAYWGHGRDILDGEANLFKKGLEAFKVKLVKRVDAYFAYTDGVRRYLNSKGVENDKIFTVNNTIDINLNRNIYKRLKEGIDREAKQFIYVGRLQKRKKIDYLLDVFERLSKKDNEYTLHLIGDGDTKYVHRIQELSNKINIKYYGAITDPEKLGKIFCQCQYLLFPGDVGLGPLHSLCFDVIPIVINRDTHGPEFEYLNNRNSHILNENASPKYMARYVHELIKNSSYSKKKQTSWNSVKSYTIENMAQNFIKGIKTILMRSG